MTIPPARTTGAPQRADDVFSQAQADAIGRAFADDPPPSEQTPAEVPKVVLCCPFYGGINVGMAHAFFGASKRPDMVEIVQGCWTSSSVLPSAFNDALVQALELRDRGQATHIAFLHSDIVPPPGWLDTLWCEMWTHGADLVSAVVPIKNESGRTSTAIGDRFDRWKIRRCVHLHEREFLPPTFGQQHVCDETEVLLVNSGCFLADVRHPAWDSICFQFHHRIVRRDDGARVVEQRSEDWEMSHDLFEAGAKVMATFKVPLIHEGGGKWANYPQPKVATLFPLPGAPSTAG